MTSAAADRENRALEAATESLLGEKSIKFGFITDRLVKLKLH